MGPRLYPFHANNYDFLCGTDIPATNRQTGYAQIGGPIARSWWGFFSWQSSRQVSQWSIASGALATFTYANPGLTITGTRGGSKSFPTTSTNFVRGNVRLDISSGDWYRQIKFAANPTLTGGVFGFGIWDQATNEYVTLTYDGTTLTCRGKDKNGLITADGFTQAVTPTWVMIYYTQSTNTLSWQYSNDGSTWTTFKTQVGGFSFTNTGYPAFSWVEYWESHDTNATPQTVTIANDNTADNQTVPRFGNFIQQVWSDSSSAKKFIVCHLDEPLFDSGAYLQSGQALGYAGQTGYDPVSGPIDHVHFHCEYGPNNQTVYTRSEQINMLVPGILPGISLTSNVAVVRSTGNDPLGNNSVIYDVTVQRSNQDFYQNTFVMVGSLGAATINYNTRAGLNANVDLPNGPGNYQEPFAFNSASTQWRCKFYFYIATYGTFVSGSIQDPNGNVLATVA